MIKWKMELVRKIGLFGLKDLRKLAPIGDLGYANGWYGPFGDGSWMRGGMERALTAAAVEQGFQTVCADRGYPHRGTDHETRYPEIGLVFNVDSSD